MTTMTEPNCKCGHEASYHFSPAIDLGLPISGDVCGDCDECHQYEPEEADDSLD